LALRYFTKVLGIQNFILDFYEESNCTAIGIYKSISEISKGNNLKMQNLISYGGDSAAVNYGIHNSVFTNLQYENDFLVKANCHCHLLHNTTKYALIKHPLDIETLISNIYNHFEHSSKRIEQLKSCYEFTDLEYKKILNSCQTRWLSLFPAIQRIIKNFDAINLYFIGVNSDLCPQIIIDFFYGKSEDKSIEEFHLHFIHDFMELFHGKILILEKENTNAIQLYSELNDLYVKLKNRRSEEFYGSFAFKNFNKLSEKDRILFKKSSNDVYNRALNYLEERFDFKNSIFKDFTELSLLNKLNYEKVMKISKRLNIPLEENQLFDETSLVNSILEKFSIDDKNLSLEKQWCKILMSSDLPNLEKIIGAVMAIPIGNDFVERIFSVMKNLWTDERNRLSVAQVKAELCIKFNFSMTCPEFYNHISKDRKLIESAKSEKKYDFLKY
jgi:hypothetical protein